MIVGAEPGRREGGRDAARGGLRRRRRAARQRDRSARTSGRRCPRATCSARTTSPSIYVHEEGWYAEHDVDLRLGRDRRPRSTRPRTDGRPSPTAARIGYDKLLLATGASPRRARHPRRRPGRRALPADRRRLRAARAPRSAAGGRVVIVGAGWIGLEVAAAAREAGCEVTVVEPEPDRAAPRARPRAGRDVRRPAPRARRALPVRGVGAPSCAARAARVGDGGHLDGGGAARRRRGRRHRRGAQRPAWPPTPGLEVDNGVVADAALRTSDPDIYAAGDVANSYHPLLGRRVRVEHWANALNGGPAAARSMLGQDVSLRPRCRTSSATSTTSAWRRRACPSRAPTTRSLYRGDRPGREFIAFWLADGRWWPG